MFFFKSYGVKPSFRCFSKFFLFPFFSLLFLFPLIVYADEEKLDTIGSCISENITHQHTGSDGGGGCYGSLNSGSKTVEIPCGGTMVYNPNTDSTGCDRCGAGYHGDQSGRGCWSVQTTTESYSYYTLNCGKNTTDILGRIFLQKNTDEWTKELILTASYENPNGIRINEKPYIWNGNISEQNSLSVSENGVNVLQLNIGENPANYYALVSVDIHNIDNTAPAIKEYSLFPKEWTQNGITFKSISAADMQPDSSEGVGLSEYPYSYDMGYTWSNEDSYLYTRNGTYQVLLRDKLGNVSSTEFTLSKIDTLGPDITMLQYDRTKDIVKTELSVSANDVMEDGSEGVGLHEVPFSFDGGATWTNKYSLPVVQNGVIHFVVRDKLGNMTYKDISISNLYEPQMAVEEESAIETVKMKLTPTVNPQPTEEVKRQRLIEENSTDAAVSPTTAVTRDAIKEKTKPVIGEPEIPKAKQVQSHGFGVNEVVFLLSVLAVTITGLGVILYLWYHTVIIYNETQEESFERVGRQWIKRKEEHYEVAIPSFVYLQCNTTHFSFHISRLFLLFHRNEEIFFFFPGEKCIGVKADYKMETEVS